MFTTGLTFFKKLVSIIIPNQIQLLLLGSTTSDSSSKNRPVTNFGNVWVTTAISKFGQGSLSFDGATQYLQYPGSGDFDFGSAPFTVETFVYIAGNSIANSGATHAAILSAFNSGGWIFLVQGDGSNTGTGLIVQITSAQYSWPQTISHNQWHHVVWCGDGTNMYFGLDGVLSAPISYSGQSINGSGNPMNVGALKWLTYDRYLNGNLEQLRITKGLMLYSGSTYNVPSQLNDYSSFH